MESLFSKVKCIAFDADDTLWVNEPYFRKAEEEYCAVLERFAGREEIIDTLYGIEMKNLAPYGYGAKAFTLSLMETAILFSNKRSSGEVLPDGRALLILPRHRGVCRRDDLAASVADAHSRLLGYASFGYYFRSR